MTKGEKGRGTRLNEQQNHSRHIRFASRIAFGKDFMFSREEVDLNKTETKERRDDRRRKSN